MPARLRAAKAQSPPPRRTPIATGDPASLAGRLLPPPVDGDAGPDLDEPFLQLAGGRRWPARFNSRRIDLVV